MTSKTGLPHTARGNDQSPFFFLYGPKGEPAPEGVGVELHLLKTGPGFERVSGGASLRPRGLQKAPSKVSMWKTPSNGANLNVVPWDSDVIGDFSFLPFDLHSFAWMVVIVPDPNPCKKRIYYFHVLIGRALLHKLFFLLKKAHDSSSQ